MLNIFAAAFGAGYAAATTVLETRESFIYKKVTQPAKRELGNVLAATHEFYRVSRDNISEASTDQRSTNRSTH